MYGSMQPLKNSKYPPNCSQTAKSLHIRAGTINHGIFMLSFSMNYNKMLPHAKPEGTLAQKLQI